MWCVKQQRVTTRTSLGLRDVSCLLKSTFTGLPDPQKRPIGDVPEQIGDEVAEKRDVRPVCFETKTEHLLVQRSGRCTRYPQSSAPKHWRYGSIRRNCLPALLPETVNPEPVENLA